MRFRMVDPAIFFRSVEAIDKYEAWRKYAEIFNDEANIREVTEA